MPAPILPDYRTILLQSKLAHKEELAELVRPGFWAIGDEVVNDPPRASSRLGGTPDLPAEFDWPRWGDAQDRVPEVPLTFIGQINCEEVGPNGEPAFPERGLLSFFYASAAETCVGSNSQSEEGAARVYYFDKPSDLVRTEVPPELASLPCGFYPAIPLRFQAMNTFPDAEHPEIERLGYS